MKTKYTFFHGGSFSQWATSKIIIDDITYSCCEQYMMVKKALLFNDQETYEKIMAEANPRMQKALGREIKNFNKDTWDNVCKQYVYEANYAKFTQNQNLRDDLMATIGTELVEASPEDKIWGIGLVESDPRAHDKSQWLGTNWLGEIITKVREDLINE